MFPLLPERNAERCRRPFTRCAPSRGLYSDSVASLGYYSLLAVGAELKNTFCLARQGYAFVSHHIGNLKIMKPCRLSKKALPHLRLLAFTPRRWLATCTRITWRRAMPRKGRNMENLPISVHSTTMRISWLVWQTMVFQGMNR